MKKEIIKEKKDETKSVDMPSKVVSDKVETPSKVVPYKVVSDERVKKIKDLLYKKISGYCKKNICSIVDDPKLGKDAIVSGGVFHWEIPYNIDMENCDDTVLDNFITNCSFEACGFVREIVNKYILDNIDENMIVPISVNNETIVFSDKIQKAKENLIASGFDENKTQFILHMAPSTMSKWRESSDDTENYSIHNGFLTFVDQKLYKYNLYKRLRQNLPYERPINTYALYHAMDAVKVSVINNGITIGDGGDKWFHFDLFVHIHDVNKKGCGYIESEF